MAYKEKDTKEWTAQWFETNARGEKKKRRKRGFETKREALEYERQKKLNNSRSMDMKLSEFMEVYFTCLNRDQKKRCGRVGAESGVFQVGVSEGR